ncbi:MAG TPA: DUF5996 family protein [Anaeromyxobacteraceae bacterium]|nr:DUF5996 family protein [Anaeromyxobacteraceae bacterium]
MRTARASMARSERARAWPGLSYPEWQPTCEALHLWTQVLGKVRMALTVPVNHWWHVTLRVSTRGLTTGPMPFGDRRYELELDLIDHRLVATSSDGAQRGFPLRAMSVAAFLASTLQALRRLGATPAIGTMPQEVPAPVPFERDDRRRPYDPGAAGRFGRALHSVDRAFEAFRGRFTGKSSPSHFFWGGFDLACTRFSGRPAPVHPPVPGVPDRVVREAYSHECASVGFWPGAAFSPRPILYAYAYPAPAGFSSARVSPAGAAWDGALGEFVLPWDEVRTAADPHAAILEFAQSAYEAAADLGRWDRAALERPAIEPAPAAADPDRGARPPEQGSEPDFANRPILR